jgi:hypothetical protein
MADKDRIGAISHVIAEERHDGRSGYRGVVEAGRERFGIAVDVCEERDPHGDDL